MHRLINSQTKKKTQTCARCQRNSQTTPGCHRMKRLFRPIDPTKTNDQIIVSDKQTMQIHRTVSGQIF